MIDFPPCSHAYILMDKLVSQYTSLLANPNSSSPKLCTNPKIILSHEAHFTWSGTYLSVYLSLF